MSPNSAIDEIYTNVVKIAIDGYRALCVFVRVCVCMYMFMCVCFECRDINITS
jgi:hypothetical protein